MITGRYGTTVTFQMNSKAADSDSRDLKRLRVWRRWRRRHTAKQMPNLCVPRLKRSDGRAQWQIPCNTKRLSSLLMLVIRAIIIHRKCECPMASAQGREPWRTGSGCGRGLPRHGDWNAWGGCRPQRSCHRIKSESGLVSVSGWPLGNGGPRTGSLSSYLPNHLRLRLIRGGPWQESSDCRAKLESRYRPYGHGL